MKKGKDLSGTTIKVKGIHAKSVKVASKDVDVAQETYQTASTILSNKRRSFWKLLKKLHPDVDDYECSFSREKLEINFLSRRG